MLRSFVLFIAAIFIIPANTVHEIHRNFLYLKTFPPYLQA